MKISKFHFLLGIVVGTGLLWGVIRFLPDGKLHIVFCNVGQGDATYIRMPNQADVLIDGGPNDQVLRCLGQHMPFYDRTLDLVVMTHPDKDHFQGLISVVKRYNVKYFVTVPVADATETYQELVKELGKRQTKIKYLFTYDRVKFSEVNITTIWPERSWLHSQLPLEPKVEDKINRGEIVGVTTNTELNRFSLILLFKYGDTSMLMSGDADSQTQTEFSRLDLDKLLPENLTVLKVPHHGSKTAVTDWFIDRLKPKMSIISVGKNSYGHPNATIISALERWGKVLRTDISGEIEVISDGKLTRYLTKVKTFQ